MLQNTYKYTTYKHKFKIIILTLFIILQVIPNNKSKSIENLINLQREHETNGSQSFYFDKFNVIKLLSMYMFICVCGIENVISKAFDCV